jgi:hypothetical protein
MRVRYECDMLVMGEGLKGELVDGDSGGVDGRWCCEA